MSLDILFVKYTNHIYRDIRQRVINSLITSKLNLFFFYFFKKLPFFISINKPVWAKIAQHQIFLYNVILSDYIVVIFIQLSDSQHVFFISCGFRHFRRKGVTANLQSDIIKLFNLFKRIVDNVFQNFFYWMNFNYLIEFFFQRTYAFIMFFNFLKQLFIFDCTFPEFGISKKRNVFIDFESIAFN